MIQEIFYTDSGAMVGLMPAISHRISTRAFETISEKVDSRFNFNGYLVKTQLSRILKQDILSFWGVIWDSIS